MKATMRRICVWSVCVGVAMIAFEEVVFASDPGNSRPVSASRAEIVVSPPIPPAVAGSPGSTARSSDLAASIQRAASDLVRQQLPVPYPRARNAFASAGGGQRNGSLDSRQGAGAILLIGGVASLVVTFAGAFPAHGDKNCSSASVYDTQDCRRLRAAGLGSESAESSQPWWESVY